MFFVEYVFDLEVSFIFDLVYGKNVLSIVVLCYFGLFVDLFVVCFGCVGDVKVVDCVVGCEYLFEGLK